MRWGMRGPFWAQSRQPGDGGVPAWSRDVPKGGGRVASTKLGCSQGRWKLRRASAADGLVEEWERPRIQPR